MTLIGKRDEGRYIFPLTSLQIGDLQSYLSDLNLFLAFESRKLYILVDNRPWLREIGPRPAHLWQLMVTKSRLSPFANTKLRRKKKVGGVYQKSETKKPKRFHRWFSLIKAVTLSRKKFLLPVESLRRSFVLSDELHRTLYGFIAFEVAWNDVQGINYLNELQTDTSLAIEAKYMRRWEFDSISQAAICISSWFPGSVSEQLQLKEYLESAIGDVFYDAEDHFPETSPIDRDDDACGGGLYYEDDSCCCSGSDFSVYSTSTGSRTGAVHTPPPTGPYKRRRVMKSISQESDVRACSEKRESSVEDPLTDAVTYAAGSENLVEAKQYKDVLILLRFNDRDLPFTLKQIITSDLRLLTLLEYGLPSWVIFLQSYPVFCRLYRPWMCPLARALYFIISFVTVLIGFYDLYKNVPILKATASRLCGPLFDWIETWEMVSRIKYLGTMLFLNNFEKAVTWVLTTVKTIRSFLSLVTQPFAEPIVRLFGFFIPILNTFIQAVGSFSSGILIFVESFCGLVGDTVEVLLSPIWFIFYTLWSIATSILYPIFWIIREAVYTPFRMVLSFADFLIWISTCVYDTFGSLWGLLSSIFQVTSSSGAAVNAEVSMWRTLWNVLFSQVFRALKSILNGFVAFFAACNRHRLSIYNRLFGRARRPRTAELRNGRQTSKTRIPSEETREGSEEDQAFGMARRKR